MGNSDWRRVEEIVHAALERSPGERMAFVREASAGDEALQREVESLLANASSADKATLRVGNLGLDLVGRQIGVYRVDAVLGAGGMGEVYRARDTKLQRDVAIKVLPTIYMADPDRRARFDREARVLASLSHPHIGAIYGFEESHGTSFLVLELIQGSTLEKQIAKGPLSTRGALRIAAQIADALDTAHERGIVHRDLKPSNIALTADDTVKVLDFGLAKLMQSPDAPDVASTATMATREGVIAGTPAYMSPEQATGLAVDKRTDIWAFGCVLYEMLAGRPPFTGRTTFETIGSILNREPDWQPVSHAPAGVMRLLRRCLEKDLKRRLHDMADAKLDIEDALAPLAGESDATKAHPRRRATIALWAMCAMLAAALAASLAIRGWPARAPDGVTRFTIVLPPHVEVLDPIAVAPNGRTLVYSGIDHGGGRRLYKRTLDALDSVPIVGTDGASHPFFSPDGNSIGFLDGRALKRIPVQGGVAEALHETSWRRGATWLSDNTVVFAAPEGLMRVDASGGEARRVTTVDREHGELEHHTPIALPGTSAVLFTVYGGARDAQRTEVISLGSGERIRVAEGSGAQFVMPGYIVYAFGRSGALWAAPFDLASLRRTGPPVSVIDGVTITEGWVPTIGAAANGSLAYSIGGITSSAYSPRHLVWVDRTGREEPVGAPARSWDWPQISPDGTRIGAHIHDPTNMDAWIFKLDRGPLVRMTFHVAQDGYPVWSPDGKRVVFWSRQAGGSLSLYMRSSDLTANEERLTSSPRGQVPFCWSSDGKLVVFQEYSGETGMDIGVVSVDTEHKSRLLLNGKSDEAHPDLSRDGRWIAYQSNLSGRWEVYVQRFPDLGTRWQVSTEGGESPIWSATGQELFYRRGRAVMSVPVAIGADTFTHGNAHMLFEGSYVPESGAPSAARSYALAPNGRFLMMNAAESAGIAAQQIIVVLNWSEELARLVRRQ